MTLPTTASLELVVHDGERVPQPNWTLELVASKWVAAWPREETAAAHVALGGSPMPWNYRDDEKERPFRLGRIKDGRFIALSLLPGLPTTLVLRDHHNVEVLRETVVLQPGEAARLERTLADDAVSIGGFVHDENGKPLPKTRIEWIVPGTVDLAWSGEDGRFRLENVRDARVNLLFQATKRRWQWLRDLDLRALSGELDVELRPGRSARYGFLGSANDPPPTDVWIEAKRLRPTPDGDDLPPEKTERIDGERQNDRFYCFLDLPEEPSRLRARIDGFTFALDFVADSQSTYNTMLRGPVEIDWTIAPDAASGRTLTALRLLPIDRGGARATLPIAAADAARGAGLARIGKVGIDRYAVALLWSDAAGQITEEKSDVVVDVAKHESARVTLSR